MCEPHNVRDELPGDSAQKLSLVLDCLRPLRLDGE
jgi:hypothetical protein